MAFRVPNQYRFRDRSSVYGSDDSIGNNGAFYIPFESVTLKIIASDGMGWEHVSVSLSNRCPNWREMSFVKSLFWSDDDTVLQFHPKKSEYVNRHPYCLHLWREGGRNAKLPPRALVG